MQESLDRIESYADKLTNIAQIYQGLAYTARRPDVNEAFVKLVEAIGVLTLDQLHQLGTTLELLQDANKSVGD